MSLVEVETGQAGVRHARPGATARRTSAFPAPAAPIGWDAADFAVFWHVCGPLCDATSHGLLIAGPGDPDAASIAVDRLLARCGLHLSTVDAAPPCRVTGGRIAAPGTTTVLARWVRR